MTAAVMLRLVATSGAQGAGPDADCRRSSMRSSTRLRTLIAALSALVALLTTTAVALAGGGNPPFPK